MQELQHKESWAPKKWWFWTVVLRKTLQSPLDSKEIQPVHPKGNQAWIFIGRTEAEAEALVLWPTDARNWLIGKDPDAGKPEAWGEGDNRGWDGWLASLTWWTWVWAISVSWWWTGKPDVLQSTGSQSPTQLNDWTELIVIGRTLWPQVLHMAQNRTENDVSFTRKDNQGKQEHCVCVCVCVCVMGQLVGMDEQTVWWSSLTGSVSLCSEMILRMSS